MGLGLSLPWMLCWLATATIPLVLARHALRRPRLVRWGPTDLLAAAARSSHLTRGGLPWLLLLGRGLVLAAAAAAAARPFLAAPAAGTRELHDGAAPHATATDGGRRIVILTSSQTAPPQTARPWVGATLPALAAAVESLAAAPGAAPGTGSGPRPEVVKLDPAELHLLPSAERSLLVLGDQPPPTPSDARRLAAAVAAGDSLLVCLGPQSVGDEDARRRTSAWLEEMAGITVDGRVSLADSCIDVADGLATEPRTDAGPSAPTGADGFATLPGPRVLAAAALGGRPATILARAAPVPLPLVVEARHGLGTICVSALPMSLPATGWADDAWSDIAAWPAFVPFVDRLVSRLLDAAAPKAPSDAARSTAAILPLAPALIAVASAALLADWWLSRRMAGAAMDRPATLPTLGRVVALAILVTMAAAWARLPAATATLATRRPIAFVVDTSPSMGTVMTGTAGPTRLAELLAALANPVDGTGPLDRIAGDRPVELFTAATRLTPIGTYPPAAAAAALHELAPSPAAAASSRIGDAVESLLTTADGTGGAHDRLPAAIIIASDGAITAGHSWATAARTATGRGVPLVAIPVAGAGAATGSLPPGFRITLLEPPRLCHAAEPFAIDVHAEATAADGPLEVVLAAAEAGRVLARGMLTPEPAADGMFVRFTGRLTVPAGFGAAGSGLASPVVLVGRPGAAATPLATCPLAVTDAPIRVLLIEAAPRFEHRFLSRLLARDAAFAVETCLLDPRPAGVVATAALPRSTAEWNRYDVVVLGDVAADAATDSAAARADAWRSLREAAAADGIGIAWIPGSRWWTDPDPGLAWLPAVPGGMASSSAPCRLRPVSAGRADAWLPSTAGRLAAASGGDDAFEPEIFRGLRAAALRPTARIIASCLPVDGPRPEPATAAAIVVDRIGAATILGHLCETWRWQRDDPQAYAAYWRRNLLRLAGPHQLDRLFPATVRVHPAAPVTGEPVRLEIVPSRTAAPLAGWQVEVVARGADPPDGMRRIPLSAAGLGGVTTVAIDGLAAGLHTARLVPPADTPSAAPAAIDLVVTDPPAEMPDGAAAVTAFAAAARASGGAVVRLDAITSLAETLAAIDSRAEAAAVHAAGRADRPGRLSSRGLAHLLLAALVAVTTAAWWQPRRGATP
jgi:hypothetical protein